MTALLRNLGVSASNTTATNTTTPVTDKGTCNINQTTIEGYIRRDIDVSHIEQLGCFPEPVCTSPPMANVMMIQLPPKIWRPKPENKYIPIDYSDDVDEGVFDFSHHGKVVYRPKVKWSDKLKNYIILFGQAEDTAELTINLNTGENVKADYKDDIINIIQDYWD